MKFNLFAKPTLEKIVAEELYEAQRNLLDAQAMLEFAQARVAAYTAQVERLRGLQNASKS